jgi:hypothetical protein
LLASPSQLPRPGLHANPQRLAVHVAVALGTAGQATPQPPQWAALVVTSTSQPESASPSQLA